MPIRDTVPNRPIVRFRSNYCAGHMAFCFTAFMSTVVGMQFICSYFRVSKSALAATAIGCLALSFATPTANAAPSATQVAQHQTATLNADTPNEANTTDSIRVATLDANLTRQSSGELQEELSAPGTTDARRIATSIQAAQPDILILTGIDTDAGQQLVDAFNTNYLAVGTEQHDGISYPYSYFGPSNAGVDSGADLDRNGTIGDAGDALGYGDFPGQSSMIVYSKYPIDADKVRDFSAQSWNSMPDNSMPERLTDLERSIIPLASISHWDIPVQVNGKTLHVLATSTANGADSIYGDTRNQDQIRFWQDYLTPETQYITDHRGKQGSLPKDAAFVLAGSLKADPTGEGPGNTQAITRLLEDDALQDPEPARTVQPGPLDHSGAQDDKTRYHTAPLPSDPTQSYRADYVLPAAQLDVIASGTEPAGDTDAVNTYRKFLGLTTTPGSSQLVWVDLQVD